MREFVAGIVLGAIGLLALEVAGLSAWVWWVVITDWWEMRVSIGPVYVGDISRWVRRVYFRYWHGLG